jgi:hypothetical protein
MAATEKVMKQAQPTEDEINAFVHKAFGDLVAMLTAALLLRR